ncbi:MAG: c-type cytochrome [Dehalococcoidia bacterium]
MGRVTSLLIPGLALGGVVSLAALLIFQIVWRPWASADNSWRTHLNLGEAASRGYTRTVNTYVGKNGPLAAWDLKPGAVIAREQEGRALYVAKGCASCHGLDAKGALFAADLSGLGSDRVTKAVRSPRGQMPAFSEMEVSDEALAKIAAYLQSLASPRPSSVEIATIQNLRWDPSVVSRALLLRGKDSLRRSCSGCHARPSKEDILRAFKSDADAARLVAEMVYETNLSLEDAKALAYYLLAILNGVDPVKVP